MDQEESGKIYLLGTRRTRLVVLAVLGASCIVLSESLNLMGSFGTETWLCFFFFISRLDESVLLQLYVKWKLVNERYYLQKVYTISTVH